MSRYSKKKLPGRSRRSSRMQGRGGPANVGYDQAAEQMAMGFEDPYTAAAQRESALGRRLPQAYAAAAEVAVRPYDPRRDFHAAFPGHAVVPAAGIAGYRQTQDGRFGDNAVQDRWQGRGLDWNARDRAGYGPYGARAPGDDPAWDRAESSRRYSGILEGVNAFSHYVHKERPFLQLRAAGTGSMLVVVTAGTLGGAEASRRFNLGGGATGMFSLSDWDTVKVEIESTDTTARLHFAYVGSSMQAGDQSLLIALRVYAETAFAVPEGAYEMYLDDADGDWEWKNSQAADLGEQTIALSLTPGVANRVLGARAVPSVQNDVVFLLRPF